MINFNYIITNDVNNKQYVGAHSTNNINDNYMGSGLLIGRAKKKYGKENFTKEILCYTKTTKEAYENEVHLIKEYNTLVPNGYNISPTGGLGFVGQFSEETKAKMREAVIGKPKSEEHKQNMKGPKSEEHKQNMRKPKSEEHKQNMKGPKSEEHTENISKALIGKEFSKERIENMKQVRKGKTYIEIYGEEKAREIIENISRKIWVYNKIIDKEKRIEKEELQQYLNNSYTINRKPVSKSTRQNISKVSKNTIWINNGNKNKRIKEKNIQKFLDSGYKRGILKIK